MKETVEKASSPFLAEEKGCKVYRHVSMKKLQSERGSFDFESYRYDVYLENTIASASCYAGLSNILRNTESMDDVRFYLANFGGSVHGLIHVLSALKDTKAYVSMNITAPCYSAGSTLALSGDELHFYEDTFLMFHNYSTGAHGKGGELIDSIHHSDKWIKTYMRRLHKPFLTPAECNKIENDKDVYVHWNDKDLSNRIKRHYK